MKKSFNFKQYSAKAWVFPLVLLIGLAAGWGIRDWQARRNQSYALENLSVVKQLLKDQFRW